MAATTVNSNDRMMFALFLALTAHAMIVLGISFSAEPPPTFSSTLDVTLAGYRSEKAPEKADFLAQENQEGSGTLDEARMMTTDVEAEFHANDIRENIQKEQQASAPRRIDSEQRTVITASKSPVKEVQVSSSEDAPAQDLPEGPDQSLLQRSLEIASLHAKVDSLRQMYAKKPKVQRLTAASTMKSSDAYYVNSWRRSVEQIGDLNYPKEAENCYDNCRLRLLVSINPDGTLHELSVLESSGRRVLDEAAMRIVRLASPFAPFTDDMRKDMDRLEIIRTWQFKGNRYLSESN